MSQHNTSVDYLTGRTGAGEFTDMHIAHHETDTNTIYPVIATDCAKTFFETWFERCEEYDLANTDLSITETNADLCITDPAALHERGDKIKAWKNEVGCSFRPVLLVLPDDHDEKYSILDGHDDVVDEVIQTTADEVELHYRMQTLKQLQQQARIVDSRADELKLFKQAVDASGHAIFMTTIDGTIQYVNPAFEEITGFTESEVIGSNPRILSSDEMSDEYYETLWDRILDGAVWEEEIVNQRADGTLYTAHQTIAPITDGDGTPTAFVAVQADITEAQSMRAELNTHRDIVERIDDPVMVQDLDGKYQFVNTALDSVTRFSKDELIGKTEADVMDEETASIIEEEREYVMNTEIPTEYTVSPDLEAMDANEIIYQTSRYPYYDESGELCGTIAICRNVTSLEQKTRQQHVIDNILRHNLRNQLSVIYGRAKQIEDNGDGDVVTAAKTIQEQADDLMEKGEKSREITSLLGSDPEPKIVNVTQSVSDVIGEFTAEYPNVPINVSVPGDVHASAIPHVSKAVRELVENSIVHNDTDTVEIDVVVEANPGDQRVSIHVIDTGDGISDLDRGVLETGEAIDDLSHGSGIGLWLVYWIVHVSHGNINLSDPDEEGMRITLQFPLVNQSL